MFDIVLINQMKIKDNDLFLAAAYIVIITNCLHKILWK